MSTEEMMAFYTKAGIGGTIGFGSKPAILVVDLQKSFTDPKCPLGVDLSDVVRNAAKLLRVARSKHIPIIYTYMAVRRDGIGVGPFLHKAPGLPKYCYHGSKWVEIDQRLKPKKADILIQKGKPSAFFGTELIQYLDSMKIDTLVIAGTSTSGCIRATVLDAVSYGFRPIVPAECVGDRLAGPHESALFDMSAKHADVMSLKDVLDYLLRKF